MGIEKSSKRIGRTPLLIMAAIAVVVLVGGIVALNFLQRPVIDLHGEKGEFFVPRGATIDDVCGLLNHSEWLKDESSFRRMAALMSCERVKPGRYVLKDGMTSRQLVAKLRSGDQTPVRVTFNNVRTLPQLAGIVAGYLEADSLEILDAMRDTLMTETLGFTPEMSLAMYLPDTYDIYWTANGEEWVRRMKHEYDKFWTETRRLKADSLGLKPNEAVIIASIIEEETNKKDEYPIIAGLYLNRLRMGMPLQACPTLKFCKGDFTIRRVLKKDQEIDNPYNTYKYAGLPPGPIRIASGTTIDAVLNAEDNEYLFMCARPDNSGRHNFARTNDQHEKNAREYQKWLNQRKIYR